MSQIPREAASMSTPPPTPNPHASAFVAAQDALQQVIRRKRSAWERLHYSGPSPTHTSGWAVLAEYPEKAADGTKSSQRSRPHDRRSAIGV